MRWRWSESRLGTMYVAAALMLELLPFEAALLLVTASDNHPIDAAALPFWFAAGVLLAAWMVGHALRRLRSHTVLLAAPGVAVSYLLLVYVSPAGLAGRLGGPLQASVSAPAGGQDPVFALVALFAATGYLWFRGLAIGEGMPSLDVVMRRFRNGLVALVAVIAVVPSIAAAERSSLVGVLTLILPVEIFCGLMATAAARLIGQEDGAQGAGTDRPWLALSTFVAGLVIGLALLLGLAFNGADLHEALRHMGWLGNVLDAVARGIGQAIATVLRVVVGGVLSIVPGNPNARPPLSTRPPICPGSQCPRPVKPSAVFNIALDVLIGIVTVAAFALLAYLAYLVVRRLASRPDVHEGIREEREMLDGRAIFARQLRGLFGWRRPPAREGGEPMLPSGTVRALYRDLLLAAAARGLPRRSVETPDEYATRLVAPPSPLAADAGTARDDLAALTDAYNGARYGEREPDAGRHSALRQRVSRLIASLAPGR